MNGSCSVLWLQHDILCCGFQKDVFEDVLVSRKNLFRVVKNNYVKDLISSRQGDARGKK